MKRGLLELLPLKNIPYRAFISRLGQYTNSTVSGRIITKLKSTDTSNAERLVYLVLSLVAYLPAACLRAKRTVWFARASSRIKEQTTFNL